MKAIIIGNSGSGKTWLATQLAVHSSAPVVHLDEVLAPGVETQRRQHVRGIDANSFRLSFPTAMCYAPTRQFSLK